MQGLNYLTMLKAIRDCTEIQRFRVGIFTKIHADRLSLCLEALESMDEEEREAKLRAVKNSSNTYIEFKNGSSIKILGASENVRGHAFNRVLYASGIDHEILNCVIWPTEKIKTNNFRTKGDGRHD